MKKIFILAVSAAFAITACNKQELPEQENNVYREFTATIDEGASTKVIFGNPSESSIPASFQVGDEIALYDGSVAHTVSVTSVSGDKATIGGELPEGFNPVSAYYPASAFKDGKLSVPSTQTYGSVPVLLNGPVDTDYNSITFSGADAGSAVVCYSLTGDIAVKEAYLYYRDEATFWVANYTVATPDYKLTFNDALELSSSAQKIYFVVPAGSKVLTLEIKADAPESAYGVDDYSYYRRKTSAVELASGKVTEMPELDFTAENLDGRMIWEFGSSNGGDCGWTVWDGKGQIDGNTQADHAVITMGVQTATVQSGEKFKTVYRGDMKYTTKFSVPTGTYRFVAMKSSAPALMDGVGYPEGTVSVKEGIKFDITNYSQWRGGTNQSLIETSADENCEIWIYDMYVHFRNTSSKVDSYIPTVTPLESVKEFQFKFADLTVTTDTAEEATPPVFDLYWIGFFNSIEEIEAYIAGTEGVSAAE